MGRKWNPEMIPDERLTADGEYIDVFDRDGHISFGPVRSADELRDGETK